MITTTAVILVAGIGSRLRPLTDHRPKALVEVRGESLLLRAARLLRAHGVRKLVLATGYREDAVKSALAESGLSVHYCYNPAFESTQNSVSLALCRKAVGQGAFFKLDGDVIFVPEVLSRLDQSSAALSVALDSSRQADAEAMKVRLAGERRIVAFGKSIALSASGGESIGIERISAGASGVLFDALERKIESGERGLYYEDVYSELIAGGALEAEAVEVGDLPWTEIDDFDDLARAEDLSLQMSS